MLIIPCAECGIPFETPYPRRRCDACIAASRDRSQKGGYVHKISLCLECGENLPLSCGRRKLHPGCISRYKEKQRTVERTCSRCRTKKPPECFVADATRLDGVYPWCKECSSTAKEISKQSNTAALNGRLCPMCSSECRGHKNRKFCSMKCKDRARALRRKYNLSPQQYLKMIEDSDGLCPVCLCTPNKWNVEHNHTTGLIMGVVCTDCNIGGIARTFHDIEYVERLLAYLKNPPAIKSLGEKVFANNEQPINSNLEKMWRR